MMRKLFCCLFYFRSSLSRWICEVVCSCTYSCCQRTSKCIPLSSANHERLHVNHRLTTCLVLLSINHQRVYRVSWWLTIVIRNDVVVARDKRQLLTNVLKDNLKKSESLLWLLKEMKTVAVLFSDLRINSRQRI